MLEGWTPEVLPVGAGGVPCSGGVRSGVGSLRRSGGGAPVPLRLQRVCGFFAVPFWQERQLDIWFWRSIAGCHYIAAFSISCPGNSTPRIVCPRTLPRGFLMMYFVSLITVREKPSLAILAIFHARHMSDCSSCTRPPSLAIVADMLKTYKTVVAAYHNDIRLLHLPYILLWPPLRWLMPALSTHGDAYQEIHLRKSQSWQHHDVLFRGLCRQMPLSTMEVSRCGQP